MRKAAAMRQERPWPEVFDYPGDYWLMGSARKE